MKRYDDSAAARQPSSSSAPRPGAQGLGVNGQPSSAHTAASQQQQQPPPHPDQQGMRRPVTFDGNTRSMMVSIRDYLRFKKHRRISIHQIYIYILSIIFDVSVWKINLKLSRFDSVNRRGKPSLPSFVLLYLILSF